MKRTFICLLVIFAFPAAAAAAGTAGTKITVAGAGSVALPPNVATVQAAVETNASGANEAVAQNNAVYDRIVAALQRLGIARDDVTLSYYNVNYTPRPQTPPQNGAEERYGYTVSRGFSVKVRRIADAGRVSDACVNAGATTIDGVAFGLADPSAARERATHEAVADARVNAEAIARAAHLRIVGISSIELGNGPVGPVPMMRAAAPTAGTRFDQSPVNVTISLTVVFLAAP